MIYRFVIIGICFCFIEITGCKKPEESQVAGWGVKAVARLSPTVEVCWENRTEQDEEFKRLRSAFSNYARAQFDRTNVKLIGWADCDNPTSDNEIRITWTDSEESKFWWGDAKAIIGRGIAPYAPSPFWAKLKPSKNSNVRAAPTLAFNTRNFANLKNEVGEDFAVNSFLGTLLHELGHAVGLLHEMAHPNNTTYCNYGGDSYKSHVNDWAKIDAEEAIKASVVASKKYDPKSIMNYCWTANFRKTGTLLELSQSDIFTINALYPLSAETSQEK